MWRELEKNYPYEMTESNHLKYRFHSPSQQYSPEATLFVQFGKCHRPCASAFEEARRAAILVAKKFSQPFCLWLSGGVDSEAMARAFISAHVPFRASIIRFSL